jgi:hypothetical protein
MDNFKTFFKYNFNVNVLISDHKIIYKYFHKSAEVITKRPKSLALKYIFMPMMQKCLLLAG